MVIDSNARQSSGVWVKAAVVAGAGLALSLGMLAPVFGETYGDPLPLVSVGTDGSDAGGRDRIGLVVTSVPIPLLAVSQGGCATGLVAVAIGESNRDCWWNGYGREADGYVSVGLLGAEGNIAIGGGDGTTAVGGGNAAGLVAVSDTGNAQAGCLTPIPWGDNCAEPGLAVSGTGSATGSGHVVSGTGPAYSTWGDEWGDNDLWPTVAASGLGNAGGGQIVVSGTGSADAAPQTTDNHPLTYPGIAVAGGDANSNGGLLAVSATGNADGAFIAIGLE